MNLNELARMIAPAYDATAKVSAVVLAGSVARGRADAYSDLELDVYWSQPPETADRRAVVEAVGGTLTELWDFASDEGEWSEEFTVGPDQVGISGFEVDWIDRRITDVIDGADPDPAWQMRLSAIKDGFPLVDHDIVADWKDRIADYPDALADAVIRYYLEPARLGSWHQRHALLARDDRLLLRSLTTRIPVILLGALSGLNRVLVEHQDFKWAAATIDQFTVAPVELSDRLRRVADQDLRFAVAELDALLTETLDLIDRHASPTLTDPIRQASVTVRGAADEQTDIGWAGRQSAN